MMQGPTINSVRMRIKGSASAHNAVVTWGPKRTEAGTNCLIYVIVSFSEIFRNHGKFISNYCISSSVEMTGFPKSHI